MKDSSSSSSYFSSLWPIQAAEYKKFFSMFLMFFLISFNYNILRGIKDTLIVTAPSSGAEALPFIKLWVLLPMAVLITVLFTKLSNKYGREKIFYIMMSVFLGYFALFVLVLYPSRELLHPTHFVDSLAKSLPIGLNGFVAIIRHWTLTSFYVMAELWGAMVMNVLFWGFANDTTNIGQAKRFYSLFSIAANMAGMVAGYMVTVLSKKSYNSNLFFGTTAWEQSVVYVNILILAAGIGILLLYRYINTRIVSQDAAVLDPNNKKMEKPKASFRKNLSYLGKSKYLICIALIVVTYNIAINLIEVIWKNQVKLLYPNPSDYSIYMGYVITATGILSTLIAIFLSGNLLRKFSWTYSAMIPPITIALTGIGFFTFFFFKSSWLVGFLSISPLTLCVFFGSLQNCISRSLKYTLFDATKEISFIPLNSESRLKGKAAIDGVGAKIGKSGGAIIYQSLLLMFSTLAACTPVVGILFLFVIVIWAGSVKSLGKQFNALIAQKEKIAIPDKPLEQLATTNS